MMVDERRISRTTATQFLDTVYFLAPRRWPRAVQPWAADYASYVECPERVGSAWRDAAAWTRMSILNTARSGKFSSDRVITEYSDDIWKVSPVTVSRPSS